MLCGSFLNLTRIFYLCDLGVGRFDYHVELPAPAASERATILEQAVAARGFECSSSVAFEVAMNFDGADGSDLVSG